LFPATPEAGAISVAERLRAAVAGTPVDVGEHVSPVNLSVSAGVAIMVPGPGMAPSDLVSRADEALYAAKAAGRNRVMVFRESGARAIADS